MSLGDCWGDRPRADCHNSRIAVTGALDAIAEALTVLLETFGFLALAFDMMDLGWNPPLQCLAMVGCCVLC